MSKKIERTCQYCGKKRSKKNHHVHHIKPFRSFGYISNQNNFYIQANDLRNLITLCSHCHNQAEAGKIFIQPSLL